MFFSNVLPPGRRLLLTPGMGMGLGTIRDHLGAFKNNFRTILRPQLQKQQNLLKENQHIALDMFIDTENDTESYRNT